MKYLAIASLVLVSGCSWLNGMQDWANETLPTYDGSRPGMAPEEPAPALPGYNYGNTPTPLGSTSQAGGPLGSTPQTTGPVPEKAQALPTQTQAIQPQLDSAVPAPHNFNAATVPTSMPREPDYYDPMIPSPPI